MADIQLGIKITTDSGKAKAELTSLGAAIGTVDEKGRKTAASLDAAGRSIKNVGSAADVAKSALTAMGAALTSAELIRTVDAYSNMSAKLRLVSGSAQELIRAQTELFRISQGNLTPLADTVQLYSRLAYSIRDMGRSQADAIALTDLIGKSLRISGASAGEMSSVLLQLSQALGSGVLRGEEFNSLRENGQRALRAIADGLGITVGQLKNLADQGKLTSEVVTTALLSQGETIRREYQTLPVTISGAFQQINNALTAYIGAADQAHGSSREFASMLSKVATNLNAILDPLAAVITTIAKIEIGGWQNFRDLLHDININLRDMAGLRGAGAPMDEETARLMRYSSGQASLAEIAGPPPGAQQTQQQFFDGINRNAQSATDSVNGLTASLKKSSQELVNATAQAFKLTDERKAVVAQIVQVAEKNGFDPSLLLAIAKTESSFDRLAKATTTSASGVFQFVKGTRERFGVKDPFDVEQATIGAIKYLTALQDQFKNTRTAVSAYYSGEGAIQKNQNQPDAKGANYAATVAKNLDAINAALGVAGKSWDSYSDRVAAAGQVYERLKLHQDDDIKRAEDYANVQVAKIKTSLAALKAEEEAQQRVTAAEIAGARTVDEKQALIAQAAQQSAAFHASEQSLVMAEINQQQKLLEAKRAALTNELKGAQAGQYAQDESQQLAIKQAIRAVDTDLAQLAETRRQAEINAATATNDYAQQSLDLKSKEAGFIGDTIAAYEREVEILNRLTAAKQAGATADQLGMLRQYYEQGAQLPDVVSTEQLARVKQYQLSTLAVKEAVDALTKSTEDQSGAEENVREAMLRMNAIWEQTIERIQQAASAWSELTNGKSTGIDKMLVDLARFGKSIDQISAKYKELSQQGKTMDDLGNTQFSETMKATALAVADTAIGMRSMFQIGEEGYKAMTALAGVALVAQDLLNISDGVSAVLKQLKEGDPYTASLRAAIVAAQVMSLGVHIAGTMAGMGSGKSAADQVKDRQAAAGTGTVLGDTKAQSQSITNSLEIIKQNSTNDLGYSAAMLRAMEDLSASILALANNVAVNVLPSIDAAINASGMKFGKTMLDPFSGFNKQLTDEGIGWFEQSLSSILKGSFSTKLYADVTKSFEIMGQAISSSTKTYIRDADNSVNAQITRIFRDIVTTLQEGAKAFGVGAGSVITALKGFKVGMEQISLKDMTMEEQTKALNAVFSKITDQIAATLNKKLKLGLAPFEKAGEGMAETFMRVSEGINRSKGELEQLGMTAINYKDIINKQGDVAAEIVRQTLEAQGHLSAGVRQYVDELTGSAEDIISAYKKLVDASNLMKTAGFGDQNLNRTMINAAGGLDAFTSAMQSFNENFLTEAQRMAGDSRTLAEQFARLGVAIPDSKDGFYKLMMGIDKTTESGQKLFGALLQLADGFAKNQDSIQGIKDKYADILNPFGKFGAQISGVGNDFQTLLDDLSSRNKSKVETFTNESGLYAAQDAQAKHKEALEQHQKALDDAEKALATEKNKKKRDQLRQEISEHQTWINLMRGALESDALVIARINKGIAAYEDQLKTATAGEKSGILADAATVMTKTLSDIFTEIQQTVDAARQKMEAAVTFQKSLATQIASLEGPDATAALMRSRAADATRAVNDYWSRMSTGAKRNTEEELRLLGEAQQAIIDKYNAELAAVQQLQQAVDGFNAAIASLRSQIATLQGPGAVASLASRNYGTAFQSIADYRAGITAGGTRDYAKEVTLIQAAQTAVMDKYNAEMALIQSDVQLQAQALQDGLQAQIDSINSSTQAQIDSINSATESRISAINSEVDAQQKAAQIAHDAQIKILQEQLQAAQRLTEAYKQISEYAKSMKLGSLTNLSPEAKLAEAQRQYQDTLAKARSGDADAASKLSGASDAYLEAARAYYGSGTQYSNIFDGVQAAMAQVGGLNGGNPDSIQAHIDTLNEAFQGSQDALRQTAQDQIKAVQDAASAQTKAIQQAAQDQIKALQENVAQQIKDLNDPDKNLAMKALKDAAVADLESLQKTAEEAKAGAEKAASEAAKTAKQYQADTLIALKAIADKAEDTRREAAQQYADAKSDAIAAQNRAAEEARKQLESLDATAGWSSQQKAALEAIARHLDPTFTMPGQVVPSHARGGYAQAGLALVGEKGAELVRFERPAQVLTAQQTREALNGESPKTFAALEAIKQELKAIVTTQSNANPQLIERLAAIEDRLNKMERNQRIQA